MLYLVQHGDAVPKQQDADRPLSAQGMADVTRIAEFLQKAGISVDRVLHSGKTRAKQSAEILALAISESGVIETLPGIDPNDAVVDIAEQITQFITPTVIVGHLPFMAKLVSFLLLGKDDVELVAYQPGSIVCLDNNQESRWTINWMIRPELVN